MMRFRQGTVLVMLYLNPVSAAGVWMAARGIVICLKPLSGDGNFFIRNPMEK
jgi:hypothetical protein